MVRVISARSFSLTSFCTSNKPALIVIPTELAARLSGEKFTSPEKSRIPITGLWPNPDNRPAAKARTVKRLAAGSIVLCTAEVSGDIFTPVAESIVPYLFEQHSHRAQFEIPLHIRNQIAKRIFERTLFHISPYRWIGQNDSSADHEKRYAAQHD